MACEVNCTGQNSRTKTEKLVSDFIHGLQDGLYTSGEKLPSIRKLAQERNVSRFTVVQAYDRLVARGVIEARAGSGYYFSIAATTVADDRTATTIDVDDYPLESVLCYLPYLGEVLCPSTAWLPGEWIDTDMMNRATRDFARENDPRSAEGYGAPEGGELLRNQLRIRLSMLNIKCDTQQILSLPSVSAGITLLANSLFDRTATILVEEPCWQNFTPLLTNLGYSVRGVKMTPQGPDLDHFEEQLKRFNVKFFLASAVIQNPTGVVTSPATIHRVLQLADKYGFMIIEDDSYAFFHTRDAVRYAELDGFNNVIYLNSYSKSQTPRLRLAYAVLPQNLVRKVSHLKALFGCRASNHSEYVGWHILQSGQYDKQLNNIRQRTDASRVRCEARLLEGGLEYWHKPLSGPFLWMRHPDYDDCTAILEKARQQNLVIAGGSIFNPRGRPMPWMRFTAPWSDIEQLSDFLATL